MNILELDKMKNEDFLEFGNSSLAFVKKENHETIVLKQIFFLCIVPMEHY